MYWLGQNLPNAIEFTLETSEEVQFLRQYAFTLPNGDILLAVWRNGPAVEEDIGILSTLTIADVSASSVTGINVFYGFEQELIAETVDNDLVIHDLLVKDYPIFIARGHLRDRSRTPVRHVGHCDEHARCSAATRRCAASGIEWATVLYNIANN